MRSFLSIVGGGCGAWGREGLVEFFVIEMVQQRNAVEVLNVT